MIIPLISNRQLWRGCNANIEKYEYVVQSKNLKLLT
jgi:hypothetical protein